jgi:hypothetical protein
MIDKILELLKSNSNTLDIVANNTPSTITFVGSVNYEDVAKKIAELFNNTPNPIIQISEGKKVGNRTLSKVLSPKEIPASLVVKHLQLAIKSIENAVEKEVTTEFQGILKTSEFVNDIAENDWIESAKHLMPMGRLSIEEPEIFWIKNPKG